MAIWAFALHLYGMYGGASDNVALFLCFVGWFFLNYQYNISMQWAVDAYGEHVFDIAKVADKFKKQMEVNGKSVLDPQATYEELKREDPNGNGKTYLEGAYTQQGKDAGVNITIATMQLLVCSVYACVLWIVRWNPINLTGLQKPEPMKIPKLTFQDVLAALPLAVCSCAAHVCSATAMIFAPIFGQIVKAAEPMASAAVNATVYKKTISKAKFLCIYFIVLGVCISCFKLKEKAELERLESEEGVQSWHLHRIFKLDFHAYALLFGLGANFAAAFKGGETKRLLEEPGIKDRFATVSNQFAVTQVLGLFMCLPLMFIVEWGAQGSFWQLLFNFESTSTQAGKSAAQLRMGLIVSGFSFYLYNELATMTIKACGAVFSSVMNTAKRVIVIVALCLVGSDTMTMEKGVGATVAIAFVMVYSIIDELLQAMGVCGYSSDSSRAGSENGEGEGDKESDTFHSEHNDGGSETESHASSKVSKMSKHSKNSRCKPFAGGPPVVKKLSGLISKKLSGIHSENNASTNSLARLAENEETVRSSYTNGDTLYSTYGYGTHRSAGRVTSGRVRASDVSYNTADADNDVEDGRNNMSD